MVVFQDEGANLIRLGHALRSKMDELREEFRPYGLQFIVNFDSSEVVEEQLQRLKKLSDNLNNNKELQAFVTFRYLPNSKRWTPLRP